MTYVEESLIARARIRCNIFKLSNKRVIKDNISQLKCCGNVNTFPQNPNELLTILPSLPSSDIIQIVFIGTNIPNDLHLKKIFTVRRQKVKDVLIWLKLNNPYYANVQISEENLNKLPDDDIPSNIYDNIS